MSRDFRRYSVGESDNVGAVILGSNEGIKEENIVKLIGSVVEVPVGEAMIGRVVNALGQPIDEKDPSALLELSCETDFVGTNPKFTAFYRVSLS